jgi:preprotein translocase subunit YajC
MSGSGAGRDLGPACGAAFDAAFDPALSLALALAPAFAPALILDFAMTPPWSGRSLSGPAAPRQAAGIAKTADNKGLWPWDAALQLGSRPLYSAHISAPRGGRRYRGRSPNQRPLMLISPAFAQAGSPFGGDNMLVSLLPFVLIFVIMYFLILRPQQKRAKAHQEMVRNVRRGDTVVTSGGLIGKVTKVIDDDQIEVEVADAVRVRQMRSMVADVRAKGEPVKEEGASS